MAPSAKEGPARNAADFPSREGSSYPAEFARPLGRRSKKALGDPFGISSFGVNLVTLPPGAWSSQRHWHGRQDELVYILEGELVLVSEAGEQILGPGMVVGFPGGMADGHHMINRSDRDAVYLEVGDRLPGDSARYPDIDLTARAVNGGYGFFRRDGSAY